MAKIKFGIDLGTTNSAISRVEKGKVTIIKSDLQKDTVPSCVNFNKKKLITVGDRSFNQRKTDALRALKAKKSDDKNVYIEFKRTMGSDKMYPSSFMEKDFSSEELSSELLKKLKSFVTDEEFKSVIITVPAMFNDNQKAATARAGELAGFSQVELLQEPIAAALSYGMDSDLKDANIVVFDFGGGTFDVALISVEDGIFQVKDTEGDNWLGGKDLDDAIVQEILIPYLKENYSINSYLENDDIKGLLNAVLKSYAEDIKINLSFNNTYNVLTDLGVLPEDDDGEEMELDIDVTSEDMKRILSPIFKKATDLTNKLLKRNNLTGNKVTSLLLVGGPTYSPILREMLTKEICKPDTSVDPMTVVAKGAAIYATNFDINEDIVNDMRDDTKIQLSVIYESQSVEEEENVVMKIDKDNTEGEVPDKCFVELTREDGGFSSGKVKFDDVGEVIEVDLMKGKPNNFNINLYDEKGSKLDCQPTDFTIIHGIKTGNATLPYNYGVEIYDSIIEKTVFKTIKGVEKNNTYPANGEKSGLKTLKDLLPGSKSEIKIPIYQGEIDAEDTRCINCTPVHTIKIKGGDIPKLLPKGSEINIFLKVVSDSDLSAVVEIPYLDLNLDYIFDKQVQKGVSVDDVNQELSMLKSEIKATEESGGSVDKSKLDSLNKNLNDITNDFNNNKSDYDTLMKTREHLKECFKELDLIDNESSWPTVEEQLKKDFYELEDKTKDIDNPNIKSSVEQIRTQVNSILEKKDVKAGKELSIVIVAMLFKLIDEQHGVHLYIGIIQNMNSTFDTLDWSDSSKARMLIDQGLREASSNPSKVRMVSIVQALYQLLPISPGSKSGPEDILGS